jgi:hypothetical protein
MTEPGFPWTASKSQCPKNWMLLQRAPMRIDADLRSGPQTDWPVDGHCPKTSLADSSDRGHGAGDDGWREG